MSTSAIAIPTLSAAQIMADLDSLNKSDPTAAISLLKAPSKISPRELRRKSRASILPEPPKFDKLGKRIVDAPALSRVNSDSSAMGGRSGRVNESEGSSGNGNKGVDVESPYGKDDDMRRAKELVALFEKKENFRQMGTTGLGKSKEKVDEVVQKYAQKQLDERQRLARGRHLGV